MRGARYVDEFSIPASFLKERCQEGCVVRRLFDVKEQADDNITRGQLVFTEIPATDPERACRFYAILLQRPLTKGDRGPNPIWVLPHAVLRFGYEDREGATSTRGVYPLGLWFWGKVWTLVSLL